MSMSRATVIISFTSIIAITMYKSTIFLTLLLNAAYYTVYGEPVSELPPFLKICHRSDPNLNECVKKSVEHLRSYLKDGIPAMNIPACEPLRIPRIEISQEAGPVSVKSSYNDIKLYGGSDFVLKSVRVDTAKDRIRLKLYIPRLRMISNYIMEGKILMLPITGNGLACGNFTDIDVITTIQGERYYERKTDKLHFRATDFYVDFDIGHVSMHLDNLFNGDQTLADAMNLFLNDNWRTVVAEIKPTLEETIADLFKTFSNKIYSKYSLDTLLPH